MVGIVVGLFVVVGWFVIGYFGVDDFNLVLVILFIFVVLIVDSL